MIIVQGYVIPIATSFELALPKGALVLGVVHECAHPRLIVQCEQPSEIELRRFHLVLTGQVCPTRLTYRGSFSPHPPGTPAAENDLMHLFEELGFTVATERVLLMTSAEIARLRRVQRQAQSNPGVDAADEYANEAASALPGALDDIEALRGQLEKLQSDCNRLSEDYSRLYGERNKPV